MGSFVLLLFSTWISFAVSTVTVGNNKASGEKGSSLTLRCSVTGNDTFEGWKTPDGMNASNSPVFKTGQNGTENDLTILRLESNNSGTWICLSKEGNNGTVAVTVLTPMTIVVKPTNVAATGTKTTATVIKTQIAPTSSITVIPIKAAAPTSTITVMPIKAAVSTTVPNVLLTAIPTKTVAPTTVPKSLTSVILTKTAGESTPSIKITIIDGKTVISWPPSKERNASYYIRYRKVDSDQWINTPLLTQNKYEFSHLDAGKEYKFQIYIVFVENVRPYTNIKTYGEPVETNGSSKKKVIAAVVISLILLALIIFDISCCFCNQCGFFYSCKKFTESKRNYKAKDATSPQEGMNLNELNANQDDPGWV